MEILHTFAEISIAVAGFAAIVAAFNFHEKAWNKHMFQGLIAHALFAFMMSCFPFLLMPFFEEMQPAWFYISVIIGFITAGQVVSVIIIDKKTSFRLKLLMVSTALPVVYIQWLNLTETYFETNYGPVAIGVFWHLSQAGLIFAYFILEISNLKMEKETDKMKVH